MSNQQSSRSKQNGKKSKKTPSKKKKRSVGSIIFKVIIALFFLGCLGLLSGAGLFWYYAKDAPKINDQNLASANSTPMFAANGDTFQEIGSEKRELVSAADVPQQLEDAVVSIEDRRFYKHIGVDPIRIVGSALSNIKTGGLQGGSTLTQQLIKLSYFSTKAEDQTLRRKAQEAWMAVQLEKQKSKQEILTYYINKVYMSNGVYGMGTAADEFYGKTLDELSLAQIALLAGLPNAPSLYDPYANPDEAKERRDTVLMTMLENEKISQKEYDDAVNTPIDDGLLKPSTEDNDWKYYEHYVAEVAKEVKEKTGKDIYSDGLKVYTNIDIDAQKRLYEIVNSDQYVQYPDDDMQVAATVMDVNTGAVVAQVGNRNSDLGGENLAVSTRRDFGSTVKPIVDYGPAIEYLGYSTGKNIVDEPYKYEGTDISLNNWDHSYMGNMTLRQALALSRNVPAAKLFADVGADNINKFLAKLGIQYKSIEQANAISSNSSESDGNKYGVSSLKMAAAYAAFANGGTYYEPHYVTKVVFPDGTEEVDAFQPEGTRAMKETTAYMITDMLKDVINYGTGTNAQIPGLYQAGKTGTSNYTDDQVDQLGDVSSPSPDSTFVGYTPTYSMAVWTGYRDLMTPVTSESSSVSSSVYRAMMQYISSFIENKDWNMPDGVRRVGNELYLDDGEQPYQPPVKPASSSRSQEVSSASSTTEESTETETETTTSEESSESSTTEDSQEENSTDSSSEESTEESSSEETPSDSSETPDNSSDTPEPEQPENQNADTNNKEKSANAA